MKTSIERNDRIMNQFQAACENLNNTAHEKLAERVAIVGPANARIQAKCAAIKASL